MFCCFINLVLGAPAWNICLFCEHVCYFTLELPWYVSSFFAYSYADSLSSHYLALSQYIYEKQTLTFCPVCLPVCLEKLGFHRDDLRERPYWWSLLNNVYHIDVLLKSKTLLRIALQRVAEFVFGFGKFRVRDLEKET